MNLRTDIVHPADDGVGLNDMRELFPASSEPRDQTGQKNDIQLFGLRSSRPTDAAFQHEVLTDDESQNHDQNRIGFPADNLLRLQYSQTIAPVCPAIDATSPPEGLAKMSDFHFPIEIPGHGSVSANENESENCPPEPNEIIKQQNCPQIVE